MVSLSRLGLGRFKKYATPMNIMLAGGGIIVAYVGYQYLTNGGKSAPSAGRSPTAGSEATRVYFQVYPPVITPAGVITITGYFANFDNERVTVPNAYYYIFDETGFHGREIVMTGSLGEGISEFTKVITLPRLKTGHFTVMVSDHPLSDAEIGPQNYSSGPQGLGAKGRNPMDPISSVDYPDLNPV